MAGKKTRAAPVDPKSTTSAAVGSLQDPSAREDAGSGMRRRLRSLDVAIPTATAAGVLSALLIWQVSRPAKQRDKPRSTHPAASLSSTPAVASERSRLLAAALEERLVARLKTAPRGSPAWITAAADDSDAIARAEQLHAALLRAGWDARPVVRGAQHNRPGYFLLVGDADPPPYALILRDALEAVGLEVGVGTAYRAYYDKMSRTRRDFSGFEFAPSQTFLLVVGRRQ